MISEDKIQEIINSTDMVSLVSEYVELTKKGNGYFGLCPFHNDSSPSFSVSSEKKIAKCMSCGEGGNPITFLKKIKNISFMEAAVILAQKASIELDVNIKPKKEDPNKKYYDIYTVARDFYSYNLFNSQSGKKALDYLHKRGLTDEVIKSFHIGLAPSEKDTLKNVLIDNGFLDLDCIEIGLIKNNGTNLYDLFSNRIMFPITNEFGQTIAFSGRLFDGSDGPKYVNTMETKIYRKGDHLYNLSNAISEINKTKRIILCEGQMDVIKIATTNERDVVCALGSALTTNQVKLIKKYAKNVLLAYDNDQAGVKATITAINLLNGLNVDVLEFPDGLDPDEFIDKNSSNAFTELITKKVNSIEFIYKSYFKNKNIYSLVDVEEIKNNVFSYIKQLKSNTIKEQLFNKLSSDLKINYDSLLKDFNGNTYTKKVVNKPNDQYMNYSPPVYDVGFEPFANNYYEQMIPPVINAPVVATQVVKGDIVDNKIPKNLEGAYRTLIALGMSNRENIATINELLNGENITDYLDDPYYSFYLHLEYAYKTYDIKSPQDIYSSFIKEGLELEEFDQIVKIFNSFTNKTKVKKLIEDSIRCILIYNKTKEVIRVMQNETDIYECNKGITGFKEIDNLKQNKI